ncbi:MAG: glycosyltransferase family 4 protein, partial [Rivularia sp. ALOHA_DT_140]|nr:glycosyltransferase family 4 protein [Rivularia sp. ALOHA_DT_140]
GSDIVNLLADFRPNIIHVEQGSRGLAYAEMITLNALLRLKAKNIFFTWWNLPYDLKFPISVLENYNLDNSHGIISGNQDGAEILRDRGYEGPIKVMPQLGVDEKLFVPKSQPELARKVGIEPNDFVVGFVGRFVPEKGIMTLLDALVQIKDKSWKCLLLGRGELKEEIITKAAEKGIKERIILVESVPHDEVADYINLMSTLILPSETTYKFKTLTSVGWKEQFGHVIIEAMACKVPVIGSDSGEIPHVIGDAGLVFPEGNFEELANCLEKLIDNPDFTENVAQMGYAKAMAQYTNIALAKQQLEFYQELLDR